MTYKAQPTDVVDWEKLNEWSDQIGILSGTVVYVDEFKKLDSDTSDSERIERAIAKIGTAMGTIRLNPKLYTLHKDLDCPKNVSIIADYGAILQGTIQVYINIKGASGSWTHLLEKLLMDKVGVKYGKTPSDYGNGCKLHLCHIKNNDIAIEYIHNSWITSIDKCNIFQGTQGIKFSFATAGSNSGASISISNSAIFDMTDAGIYVDGITTDGYHIQITNTDIEHCKTSIKTVNAGDGTITITAGHFELNTDSYLDLNGGRVFINGCWMFQCQTGYTAYFIVGNNAMVFFNSGRCSWDANKLSKITGTGYMFVDTDKVNMQSPFVTSPHHSASTKGLTYPTGLTTSKAKGPITIPTGSSTNLYNIKDFDQNTYEMTAMIKVTSVSTTNKLRVYMNPGGAQYIDITLPNFVGAMQIKVTYDSTKMQISYVYAGTGNNVAVDYLEVNITHALSVVKYIDMQNMGDSAMAIYDFKVRIV